MYLKETGLECELVSYGSGQGRMADTCGQSNEPLVSMKSGQLTRLAKNYWLCKNDPAPWSFVSSHFVTVWSI